MYEQEEIFEQAELKVSNLKNKLNIGDLQFERIKSTMYKSSIWDKDIDKAVVDFMNELNELNEDEQEEMKFRYEAAKLASVSTQALWDQLNKCAGFELSKENMVMILSAFVEAKEPLALHDIIIATSRHTEVACLLEHSKSIEK